MSDGWTYENLKEHYAERDKRALSEQERTRAAKGFVGALSELAGKPTWRDLDDPSACECATKPTRKPRAHPERDLEKACSDLLQLDGWRMLKTDPGSDVSVIGSIRRAILGCPALNHVRELIFGILKRCTRGKGFGEVGMADCLYIRYDPHPHDWPKTNPAPCQGEILWIEFKSLTGKVSQHQRLWHAAERARGALTWIAGQDFPATTDGFLEHYRSSGLMRRKI